jgi:hypothetical protein
MFVQQFQMTMAKFSRLVNHMIRIHMVLVRVIHALNKELPVALDVGYLDLTSPFFIPTILSRLNR